jgi:hypothetical protein
MHILSKAREYTSDKWWSIISEYLASDSSCVRLLLAKQGASGRVGLIERCCIGFMWEPDISYLGKYAFDPIVGLDTLAKIWESSKVCRECIEAQVAEGNKKKAEIWTKLDVWLESINR